MTDAALRRGLSPGSATGMGSLPHADPNAAARLALAATPRLPATPQLPNRTPDEGMLVQWLRALPGVVLHDDGSFSVDAAGLGEPEAVLDDMAHGGFLAFVDHAATLDESPRAVKTQLTGPLTLGLALHRAGVGPDEAFRAGADLARAWADALTSALSKRLSNSQPVVFFDEPGLTTWQAGDDVPLPREDAVDTLSGVLAGTDAVVGVHVCGDGDRRMAIEAGPDVVGMVVGPEVALDAVALGRYLDGGGWLAWGAVPTDRPVGDHAEHWWKALVTMWCDLTVAGCDPVLLRQQSLITPACGLAGQGEAQAERLLALAVELGERVREQAVATRLSVGA